MGEGLKEACALFGIYGHPDAAYLTYLALQAQQHRGQESCGIVSSDGNKLHKRIRMGHVAPNYSKEHFPGKNGNHSEVLHGYIANGHVRYSTTGESKIENAGPLVFGIKKYGGQITVAHNGNLTNTEALKDEPDMQSADFKTTTDSEVIGKLIARSKADNLEDAIVDALQKLEGAYSLIISSKDSLYACRDPQGHRPLSIGRLGKEILIASETCAFDVLNATWERDLAAGELVSINPQTFEQGKGYSTRQYIPSSKINYATCLFELVYFARPDSMFNGIPIADFRIEFGKQLAREYPVEADMVIPVPDSGSQAADGYARESKIPLVDAYVRNHYVGRTFINPDDAEREPQIDMKLNLIKPWVKGKRVVVVDDSIIRGKTSRRKIHNFRDAGAKEVHLRISCPPTKHPCYYGIDFPNKKELIAAEKSIEDIRKEVGADTLGYLSLEGMVAAAKRAAPGFCTACWTGVYPTKLTDKEIGKKC